MSAWIYEVDFTQEVFFTDAVGVSFVNTTTGEAATAVSVSTIHASPTKIVGYNLTWVIDPIALDAVEFRYDAALGSYKYGSNPELYPGSKNIQASWVDNLDDTYTHTGTVADEVAFLDGDGVLAEGAYYDYVISIIGTLGGETSVKFGGVSITGNTDTLVGDGIFSRTLPAENVGVDQVRVRSSLDAVTMSNISIKVASPPVGDQVITLTNCLD